MTNETTNVAERLQIGPRENVTYPIIMKYCGHCTMPIEVSLQWHIFERITEINIW